MQCFFLYFLVCGKQLKWWLHFSMYGQFKGKVISLVHLKWKLAMNNSTIILCLQLQQRPMYLHGNRLYKSPVYLVVILPVYIKQREVFLFRLFMKLFYFHFKSIEAIKSHCPNEITPFKILLLHLHMENCITLEGSCLTTFCFCVVWPFLQNVKVEFQNTNILQSSSCLKTGQLSKLWQPPPCFFPIQVNIKYLIIIKLKHELPFWLQSLVEVWLSQYISNCKTHKLTH